MVPIFFFANLYIKPHQLPQFTHKQNNQFSKHQLISHSASHGLSRQEDACYASLIGNSSSFNNNHHHHQPRSRPLTSSIQDQLTAQTAAVTSQFHIHLASMKAVTYSCRDKIINSASPVTNPASKPPSAYWTRAKVQVTNFNLSEGEMQIMNYIAKDCYDAQGNRSYRAIPWPRVDPPFTISSRKNRFVAIGCDTYAIFRGFRGEEELVTGCMSVCNNLGSVDWEACSGVGCCQTRIPHGLKNRTVRLSSYNGHKGIWSFNPCSYAFIVQDGLFTFNMHYEF